MGATTITDLRDVAKRVCDAAKRIGARLSANGCTLTVSASFPAGDVAEFSRIDSASANPPAGWGGSPGPALVLSFPSPLEDSSMDLHELEKLAEHHESEALRIREMIAEIYANLPTDEEIEGAERASVARAGCWDGEA